MKQIPLFRLSGLVANILVLAFLITSCTKKTSEINQNVSSEEVASKASAKPPGLQEVQLRITVRNATGDKITSDVAADYVNGTQNVQAIFSSSGYFQFNTQNITGKPVQRWLKYDFSSPSQVLITPPSTANLIGTFLSSGISSLQGTYIAPQNLALGQSECIVVTGTVTNSTNSYQVNFHRGVEDVSTSPTSYMVLTRTGTGTWTMEPVGSCSPNSNIGALRDASAGITYGYYNLPFSFALTKL
jgi:hypothetical protein